MPHILPVDLDDADADTRAFLEEVGRRRGEIPHDARMLARRPAIMRAVVELQEAVMLQGELDIGLKFLIAEIVSTAAGCTHCQAQAAYHGHLVGVPDAKLAELWEFETSELFTEAERAALRLALAAGQSPPQVTSEHFDQLRRHYDEGLLVEVVAVISLYGWTNRWNDTVATWTEDAAATFAIEHLAHTGFDLSKHRPDLAVQEGTS